MTNLHQVNLNRNDAVVFPFQVGLFVDFFVRLFSHLKFSIVEKCILSNPRNLTNYYMFFFFFWFYLGRMVTLNTYSFLCSQ